MKFLASGFRLEAKKISRYRPHVTLRLGVELDETTLVEAKRLFPFGRIVKLQDWSIYRLKSDETKRLIHEVKKKYFN